ncbi:hypothetical protein QVE09_09555 [Paenibacillus sp. ClWae2A]|uniref:hypothetical protein n=1 Tax=Paenibacillus sp. ClWae2A TaxID=3057177 RepID=UPI0028F60BF5|nr:hypothetical protein [Paenibacillus sp. ClWae2A]MDT9719146.1 hypothetical protein [Paenibacillus sp. ClWae2A]
MSLRMHMMVGQSVKPTQHNSMVLLPKRMVSNLEQLITIEQLEELSQDQKDRLRAWWYAINPGRFDLYVVLYKYDDGLKYEGPFINTGERDFLEDFNTGEALPLLSIGQMIAIIRSKAQSKFSLEHSVERNFERWGIPKFVFSGGRLTSVFVHTELRDALWLAVKAVL